MAAMKSLYAAIDQALLNQATAAESGYPSDASEFLQDLAESGFVIIPAAFLKNVYADNVSQNKEEHKSKPTN